MIFLYSFRLQRTVTDYLQRKYGDKVDEFVPLYGQHAGGGNGSVYAIEQGRQFITSPPPPIQDDTYREVSQGRTTHNDYLDAKNENNLHQSSLVGSGARSNQYEFKNGNEDDNRSIAPIVTIIRAQTSDNKPNSLSASSSHSSEASNHRLMSIGVQPPSFYSNNQNSVTENIETKITRNTKKNIIINEEENYQILQAPSIEQGTYYVQEQSSPPSPRTTIIRLQGPYTTRINMATEHIADAPQWEETTLFHIQYEEPDNNSPNIATRQNAREMSNTPPPTSSNNINATNLSTSRNESSVRLGNPASPVKRASIEIVNEEPVWERLGKYDTLVDDSSVLPNKSHNNRNTYTTSDDNIQSRSDDNLKNNDYEQITKKFHNLSPHWYSDSNIYSANSDQRFAPNDDHLGNRSISFNNLDQWPAPPNFPPLNDKAEILPYDINMVMRTKDVESTLSDEDSEYESVVTEKNGRQKRYPPVADDNDDIYKTAGIDEIEIETTNLVQHPTDVYDDILPRVQTKNRTYITPQTTEQQLEHQQTITNVVRKNVEATVQRKFQTKSAAIAAAATSEHLTND
ncbi:unnamed protein product [Didymodactylos carnosus]|uniref:Uncharacterized protein n=1 Tax=Didymodactylos carnosus TaxID=1234261 RepID=A0A813NE03_9BILA|nr:unnamed protein product [Didymodactylos carnosus]CAF0934001.1 unnamed protein product [Didymodactylos carnosus]CAF3514732.1 unnamed protein product [Didymodactylos carnosus]CAF3709975.1 unnamed protein product [Didymodactylos carnosus]